MRRAFNPNTNIPSAKSRTPFLPISKESEKDIQAMLDAQRFEPLCASWLFDAKADSKKTDEIFESLKLEEVKEELRDVAQQNFLRYGAIGNISDGASRILEAEQKVIQREDGPKLSEKRISQTRTRMKGTNNSIDKKIAVAAIELEHFTIREMELVEAISLEICEMPELPTWSQFRWYCGKNFFRFAALLRKHNPSLVEAMHFDTNFRVGSPTGKLLDMIPDRSIWADGYVGETFMGEKPEKKERFGSLVREKKEKGSSSKKTRTASGEKKTRSSGEKEHRFQVALQNITRISEELGNALSTLPCKMSSIKMIEGLIEKLSTKEESKE